MNRHTIRIRRLRRFPQITSGNRHKRRRQPAPVAPIVLRVPFLYPVDGGRSAARLAALAALGRDQQKANRLRALAVGARCVLVMQPLAKPIKHPEIRLLRQLHSSTTSTEAKEGVNARRV